MKLNIGAGDVPLPGYTPVDRKLGSEAYPLNYPDASVEEIRASHVLEHFDWRTVPKVVADWRRVLKPGGILKIAVPNMQWIASNIDHPQALSFTMGGQVDANDFHKSAFTPNNLTKLLQESGFDEVTAWDSTIKDCAALPVSLNLQGRKPAPPQTSGDGDELKIHALASMPRLAFADNMFCALQALTPLHIPFQYVSGAFWGQCLERGMQNCIRDGAEWILTLDYDTVFTVDDLQALIALMAEHPEADAIAPLQARREEDVSLLRVEDESGNVRRIIFQRELDAPLLKVTTAHFGLTLFRVESLLRMRHPWFLAQPNAAGEWGEGRVDDDIYFWNKWKATGNTLFLATQVRVGHLQLMASWPDEKFRPQHQYISDYHKNGAPKFSPLAPAQAESAAPGFGAKAVIQ